jgi:hypothetical protein
MQNQAFLDWITGFNSEKATNFSTVKYHRLPKGYTPTQAYLTDAEKEAIESQKGFKLSVAELIKFRLYEGKTILQIASKMKSVTGFSENNIKRYIKVFQSVAPTPPKRPILFEIN